MAAVKTQPKDAQVMGAILKEMGILEYEPRVLNQMLEFTYRYVTTILEDAKAFSAHSKKKNVDVDDVRLSVQLQMDKSFTSPPPRDLLIEIARQKNNMTMPLIKANAGPRLPPDRYTLTAINYRMKSAKKPRTQITNHSSNSRLGPSLSGVSAVPALSLSSNSKMGNAALSLSSKSGATFNVVTKGLTTPTVTVTSRPNPLKVSAAPTPIFKLSTGSAIPTPNIQMKTKSADPVNGIAELSNKRKREMDDYDIE